MANSSIHGGQSAPRKAPGRDTDALGPSDSSDSGSDVQNERTMPTRPDNPGEIGAVTVDTDSDTDASGTGERASATGEQPREAADILPDRAGADGDVPSADELEELLTDEADDSEDDDEEYLEEDSDATPGAVPSPSSPKRG